MKKILFVLMIIFTLNSSFARNTALVIGMDKTCHSCGPDALVMQNTLQKQNFDVKLMMSPTVKSVLSFLDEQSKTLRASDMFVVFFSGHGGSRIDYSGDETDGYDEFWILKDYSLLDDTLRAYFTQFNSGVNILFLSDSCRSGTMYKSLKMPTIYKSAINSEEFKANLIAITATADDETSYMGTPYSQFTNSLIQVWDNGNFQGNYPDFYKQVYDINLEINGRHVQYYSEGFTVDTFESMIPFSNH